MNENINITLLKRAKQLLESKRETCVCYAITTAARRHARVIEIRNLPPAILEARANLQNWVYRLMGRDNIYLGDWLEKNVPDFDERDFDRIRATRIAWVEWMIQRVEANGGEVPA